MSHFYERSAGGDVIPRHFVPMSSRPGESRPTRITDARKAGWYPSVTTIQGLLDKPALTDWKITEHIKYLWNNPDLYRRGLGYEGFVETVKRGTQTELDKAPKDGTDFHDVLEKWFKGDEIEDADLADKAFNVDECLQMKTGIFGGFRPETSFVHLMGFAGKVDLHIAPGWVIDFKTKNTADKWKPGKMAYPEHAMQLAAYRVGLGLDNARCANVFICLETGEVEFYEWGEETLNRQWANFADLLRIWLRNAEYVPGSKPAGNNS